MRQLFALLLLSFLAVAGCGATLAVTGRAPTTLSEGACADTLGPAATSPMWVMARAASLYSGVRGTLVDSLWRNPGEPFEFAWTVAPGTYVVTAWAKNVAGAGCSTSVTVTATSRPAAPKLWP